SQALFTIHNSQFTTLVSVVAVGLLAGVDANGKPVLGRREWARRVGREDTGRVVGLVEVHDDAPLFVGRRGIEKTPAAVCLLPVGLIAEDQEELFVAGLLDGVQAVGAAVDVEDDRAGRRLLVHGAEDVRNANLLA